MPAAVAPSVSPDLRTFFAVEYAVTAAYRAHRDSHPALREAACLRAMFPAALSPLLPGDRLAGRFWATPGIDALRHGWHATTHRVPFLGFLPLAPGAGGSGGYFCHRTVMAKKLADLDITGPLRAEVEALADFWETEQTPAKVRAAYPPALAAALPADDWQTGPRPAYGLYRLAGPHMDPTALLEQGIPGLRARVQARAQQAPAGDQPFFTGLVQVLDLLAEVCQHYAQQARELAPTATPAQRAYLHTLAGALERLAVAPPATLLEATQLAFLYLVLSGAYCFGRMDDYLGPFLVRDLEAGRLDEAAALDLICQLWQLINDQGAPYDNRVIIGGKGRRHEAAADRFALLAIEATRRLALPLPQLSLRFYPEQNPALYQAALDCLGQGRTFPMLYADAVNIPAAARAMGVSEAEATQYLPYGCGEYVLYNRSLATPSGVFNATKILNLALRGGIEPLTGEAMGPAVTPLTACTGFEAVWEAWETQLRFWIERLAEQEKIAYEVMAGEACFLFYSLLFDDCLSRGQPLLRGGLRHLGGTLESYGQINAADALTAIRHCVFEAQTVSAPTLMAALEADFVGYEAVQAALLAAPKYGNDDPEADEMAVRVHETICRITQAQAARVGLDSYLIVLINNAANVILGRQTTASADGRHAGDHLANGNNPMPGRDQAGITALLHSLVKLDPSLHAGAVQNLKLSPTLFTQERPKLEALLRTYFRRGAQAMLTVVQAGDLEAALREPEKWGHLMVRVGGFSARFVELPPDVQQEIIQRTLLS